MRDEPFDDLARVLAKPIPRRTALRIVAVGMATVVVPGIRPRWAGAALAAPCSSGGTFCGYQDIGVSYNLGCCMGAGGDTRTVCCPGKSGVVGSLCCSTGYRCGNTVANAPENCICDSKVVCDGKCCKRGEYCETRIFGEDFCERKCPGTGKQKCIGVCCTGLETCGFFGCSCKDGYVSAGTGLCVKPRQDPGDPKPGWNPFRTMFNMMGQSSSAHGGGAHGSSVVRRSLFARSAQTSPAAVNAALDALAAVNGQGAVAMLGIRGGKRDKRFRQKVSVARAKPPTIFAGAGLDAGSAAALNNLLVAEARANALIAAMAKALWRARGARASKNRAGTKRQLLASAKFAAEAVTALKRVQPLRTAAAAALTAGGVAEVLAFDTEVEAFVAEVKSAGIPATLRSPMAKLGVAPADFKVLRAGVLERTVASAVGPVLIAPLKNEARAGELQGLISELSTYSTRARKHPTAR